MKSRYNDIQKITLSAFLLVLATVATVVVKTPSIPFLPGFCKISFVPAIVMFASFALGPLYGAIVGGGADLLGVVLHSTGAYNPFYTILAILWGVLPWLLLNITSRWRRTFRVPWMIYVVLGATIGLLAYGLFGNETFAGRFESTFGPASLAMKIVILSIIAILDAGLIVGLYFTNRYFQRSILDYPDIPSPNEVSLIVTICELLLAVLGTAGALAYYFSTPGHTFPYPFHLILLFLLALSPINIIVNSALLSWLLIFSRKFGMTSRNNGGKD
ncbi:MAG: ECF transporter S component [Bacilli bacterium]|nr:ECF transporter S component [Bacilli bacterium]